MRSWHQKRTLTTTIGVLGFLPMLLGAEHRKIVPAFENGEVVLFDAERHGLDTIRNYTATWKEGSNLIPVTEQVIRNGEQYVEISCRDNRLSWEDLVTSGRLVALRNQFAVRPNPYPSETIRPLDIRARMNRRFNAFLKQAKPEVYQKPDDPTIVSGGETEIGFVPTTLGPEDGNNCLVVGKGGPEVSLPIDGHYSSLIFLHTAHLHSRDGILPTTYRRWPYGFPCGDYIVRYDDGEEAVLPLRFEYNIRRFDVPAVNRATNDNRYIHTLKDANGNDVHLFQWEWVNPRPGRKIVQVTARHDNELDVSLVLFALSGRDVFRLE